jgi:cyclopropane fatty-acyl-phospholipid synthase-like methyltransferase
MTGEDEREQVAATLDASPELMPWVPELLADLFDLGSSPALVSEWVGALELPPGARVLDLGCGKGAVSLTLVRDLGVQAHGVDLCEPFIDEARRTAEEWGVSGRCRFEKGDLRAVARTARGYDVVVYASVGALGRLDAAVAALRPCVRDGGFMVVDEGFLAPGAEEDAEGLTGFEDLADHPETRRRLTSHGDAILREHVLSSADMRAIDQRYIESITARAEVLAAGNPEHAELILGYVDRQRRAADTWERVARSAAWLLQKG